MIRTLHEAHLCLVECVSRCTRYLSARGLDTESSELRKAFHEADDGTLFMRRALRVYNGAQKRAELHGFVGVGCITFAENRLVEFQRRAARVLSRT